MISISVVAPRSVAAPRTTAIQRKRRFNDSGLSSTRVPGARYGLGSAMLSRVCCRGVARTPRSSACVPDKFCAHDTTAQPLRVPAATICAGEFQAQVHVTPSASLVGHRLGGSRRAPVAARYHDRAVVAVAGRTVASILDQISGA